MFFLRAVTQQYTKDDEHDDMSASTYCCCLMVGSGLKLASNAAYNAIGYALLSGNALMTEQLTMGMAVQSGVIGAAVLIPVAVCVSCCNDQPDPNLTLACGSCEDVLDAVINSLIGAGIQGLFVTNVTTPAYIAAGAATGAAAFVGGAVAAVIIVGGVGYFCAAVAESDVVLIPTNCFPKFSCKDLVRPCEIGLSICSREQMQALIESCAKCCAKRPAAAPANVPEMTREQEIPVDPNNIPYAREVILESSLVTEQGATVVQAPEPSAPRIEEVKGHTLNMG